MTIDKEKLNTLAERVMNARRFCVDEHHRELAVGVQALLVEVGFLQESRAEARSDRNSIGDRYDAAINERDRLKIENDTLKAVAMGIRDVWREDAERAAYWRQRAKSAEGHLYGGDFQVACKEVHRASSFADTPFDQLHDRQKARISSVVGAVLRAVNAQRDRRRPADFVAYRDELASKVICDLDLFEDLRDSAATEADQHRQCMAAYRPERQQLLDEIVERCDRLIADVTGQRDKQNLTHQASDHSKD